MSLIYIAIALGTIYILLTFLATFLVHQWPRKPVQESPDWGSVLDTRIPTANGGFLEVWRVEPVGRPRGVVVLAHGWSRNPIAWSPEPVFLEKWDLRLLCTVPAIMENRALIVL